MKLKLNKETFLRALGLVTGAISNRAPLPILSNVLIETLGKGGVQLTGTDLEVGTVCRLDMEVQEEGSITVPAKKLHDIVRELPQGDCEFTVAKNNAVTIKSERSFFKIMGLPKDDFPQLPNPDLSKGLEVEQQMLQECLNLTTFAVSRDETRYVLNGILCTAKEGLLKFVATDGRRLAFIQKQVKMGNQFSLEAIVPAKAIQEVMKVLSGQGTVRLIPLKNQIVFHFGDTWVVSRLIEGHFPNYEQVIPKEERATSTLDRERLLAAVKRASLLTSPEAQSVKMDVLRNKLLISSRSPNLGEAREEVETETTGDEVVIGFNPSYLLDVLKSLDVEKVSLTLTTAEKPVLVKGKEGYLCVIMPMQLN